MKGIEKLAQEIKDLNTAPQMDAEQTKEFFYMIERILSHRELQLIKVHYGFDFDEENCTVIETDGHSLEESAQITNYSVGFAQQILAKAFRKLKANS